MSASVYNAEHYADPTACEAMKTIEREAMPQYPPVYICSAFSGDTVRNADRARRYARFALSQGKQPIVPHLHFPQFMDDGDKAQRELGLTFALEWLDRCAECWVFGDTVSEGMKRELFAARRQGIPVRLFDAQCREICNHHDKEASS